MILESFWNLSQGLQIQKIIESKKKDLESKDKFIDSLVEQMDELLMRKSEIIQRKNEHIESLSEMFGQANAELKSSRAMYADQAIKLNDLKLGDSKCNQKKLNSIASW